MGFGCSLKRFAKERHGLFTLPAGGMDAPQLHKGFEPIWTQIGSLFGMECGGVQSSRFFERQPGIYMSHIAGGVALHDFVKNLDGSLEVAAFGEKLSQTLVGGLEIGLFGQCRLVLRVRPPKIAFRRQSMPRWLQGGGRTVHFRSAAACRHYPLISIPPVLETSDPANPAPQSTDHLFPQ
jgi:hypothetical protein